MITWVFMFREICEYSRFVANLMYVVLGSNMTATYGKIRLYVLEMHR